MTRRAPAPLAPDLEQGLKRLKLRRMRQLAPELLQTAKTQRWIPEELLRTLVEVEIAARDDANLKSRLRAAGFPQPKRLEDFQLAASSIPLATFDLWVPKTPFRLQIRLFALSGRVWHLRRPASGEVSVCSSVRARGLVWRRWRWGWLPASSASTVSESAYRFWLAPSAARS